MSDSALCSVSFMCYFWEERTTVNFIGEKYFLEISNREYGDDEPCDPEMQSVPISLNQMLVPERLDNAEDPRAVLEADRKQWRGAWRWHRWLPLSAAAKSLHDSVQPHSQQPTRLCPPWDSPGKNTGMSCHCLLLCLELVKVPLVN